MSTASNTSTIEFEVRPDGRAIRYVGRSMRTVVQPGDTVVLRLDDDRVDARAVHVRVATIEGDELTGHITRASSLPELAQRKATIRFTACNIFRCTLADDAAEAA